MNTAKAAICKLRGHVFQKYHPTEHTEFARHPITGELTCMVCSMTATEYWQAHNAGDTHPVRYET